MECKLKLVRLMIKFTLIASGTETCWVEMSVVRVTSQLYLNFDTTFHRKIDFFENINTATKQSG